MKLTVLLPGLAWPDADTLAAATDGLVLPELSWLLARATRTPLEQDADRVLAQQFGLGYTPVARVAGLADGLETRQGYWLRIDPVYLRAEREALVLADSGVMSISQQEADRLVASLNQFFAEDGLRFHAPVPDRWYLEGRQPWRAEFTRLEAVIGENVDSHLPRGETALLWHRWLNELQMLLFSQAVNAEREGAGELPINSVWPWGDGDWPNKLAHRFDTVLADDAFACGLARLSGARLEAAPFAFDGMRDVPGRRVLVQLDRLVGASQYRDAFGWREHLEALETDWFAPLRLMLTADGLEELTLLAPGRRGFAATVRPSAYWRFWRGRPALSTLL
ncbi:MAG: hypothetical protein KBE25_07020 [Laribacter sp.]|nr:hypothetical protein [Laribacter sp.]MBP9528291.1 hypothetical protein [Laribacter sp.]MBP9609088.1 hypothetical protein [Laribacter sp.]